MQFKTGNDQPLNDLRSVSTLAVVIIHIAGPFLYQYGTAPNSDWWIAHIFDSFARFCVPVFLMLTGALLIPKHEKPTDFYTNRFPRILYPFLFWSLAYITYDMVLFGPFPNEASLLGICKFFLARLWNGASYHLWYIYMLVGIYALLPFVGRLVCNKSKKQIGFLLALWIIYNLLNLPADSDYWPQPELSDFLGFLGYPVLGYFLAEKVQLSRIKPLAHFLFWGGVLTTIIGTYAMTRRSVQFREEFYSFFSPNVLAASIGIFLLFKQPGYKPTRSSRVSDLISKYSYGIFLSHVLVLKVLKDIGFSDAFIHPAIRILIVSAICCFLGITVCYAINKVPFGDYFSGVKEVEPLRNRFSIVNNAPK